MSESLFTLSAARPARKQRYALASTAVPCGVRGDLVGLGKDQNDVPYLILDKGDTQLALPVYAVVTAITAEAISYPDLVKVLQDAGKLDALVAAIASATKPKAPAPK